MALPFPAALCRQFAAALLATLSWGCPAGAAADPPRLLVAYPAGGPADLVARQVAASLQQATGETAIVENVAGAAGGIGVARLLGAGAGAWLVGTPSETIVAPLLNPALSYRPEQLRLIGIASEVEVALVGRPDAAQTPLSTLLHEARTGALQPMCGNYGVGSLAHLAARDLEQRTGARFVHVPHGGVAPLLRELAAGRVELAFLPVNRQLVDLVDQGRLRLLAVASTRRDPRFPGVPTVDEAAGTTGLVQRLWVGLFVPARGDDEVVARARSALTTVLADPAYRQQKDGEGVRAGRPMTAAQADAFHTEEIAYYRRLAENLGP